MPKDQSILDLEKKLDQLLKERDTLTDEKAKGAMEGVIDALHQ